MNIAISNHRHTDRTRHGVDHLPVRLAAVSLRAGAAVDRDRAHAAILESLGHLHRIDRLPVPANADLGGHRNHAADRTGHPGCHLGEQWAVLEQRRTAVLRHHLVHRATEVDVDEIRLFPIDDFAGRLAHALAVGTEQLHAHRPLPVGELGVFPRPVVRCRMPSAETNSVTITSAPSSLQIWRNTTSVTPAIGAR
jgi:hypothetical protein